MAKQGGHTPTTIEIGALGAQGDGVGTDDNDARVYIPDALPGETWGSENGEFRLIGAPSANRIPPSCHHFDVCGGCATQHMSETLYKDWKQSQINSALEREKIQTEVLPLWSAPQRSRRRATFEATRTGAAVTIGFHKRQSHSAFDMKTCAVLSPAIVSALPALREMADRILSPQGEARVAVTHVDNGLMVSVVTKQKATFPAELQGELARLSKQVKVVQLMINGEMFVSRELPTLAVGPSRVTLPEKTFLQAVPEAESEMQRHVCEGLKKSKSIADIFCGVGTFALPLARNARVLAYDNDQPAIEALTNAAHHTQGLKPLIAARRDLFRQPLGPLEFKGQAGNGQRAKPIDGVVINPPRAGAKAQCEQLAKSAVRRIVMVSCNPATFTRDARLLIDGGYKIGPVAPIDQFLWSPHLEVVATFTRS